MMIQREKPFLCNSTQVDATCVCCDALIPRFKPKIRFIMTKAPYAKVSVCRNCVEKMYRIQQRIDGAEIKNERN